MIHFDVDPGRRSFLACPGLACGRAFGPPEIEQCSASPEIAAIVMHQSGRLTPFQQRVRDMQEESAIGLSNQSKERALVGEVISTVALMP